MTPAEQALERVRILRHAYWTNGYRPLAVWSPGACYPTGQPVKKAGKQPVGEDWRQRARRDPPDAVTASISSYALNTGILTGEIAAVDVDVPLQWLVDSVVHRVERMLGPTPLVRIGRAPKTLLVYRLAQPLAKLATPPLFLPDGSKVQIEVLGDGQQFVADGIHPDTSQPYRWTGDLPADVPLRDLPVVDQEMLRDMLEEVERILREAGAVEKEKPATAAIGESLPRCRASTQNGSDFFRTVNTAALANIEAWVRRLFPTAKYQSGTRAWRISSEDLSRDLEEDLSIHPGGITDFGVEKPQTAIDLVITYGSAIDALAAARWLCERLGIEPTSLGWRNGHDSAGAMDTRAAAGTAPSSISSGSPANHEATATDEGVRIEDFYAYMPAHAYIFAPTRELWPRSSVNARIPPTPAGVDKDGKPTLISAAAFVDQNRPVEQMTWAPGLPMIIGDRLISEGGWIKRNNVSCFNLYRPPALVPGDAKLAQLYLDHVNRIYPEDAPHILCWLAHRVQYPEDKINHALVLGGRQGIGKDTLVEPVKRAVGPWNVAEPSPQQLLGRFNGYARSVILRVNEARDLGEFDRFKFYDHMKIYTASPPDVIRVDEKHLREHNVLNVCGVIITTNYRTDGLYLSADDRRHYVAWSLLSKEDFTKDYWNELWGWYDNGGDRHVAAYLAQLDLTDFNPKAPPPKTAAFWDIVNASCAPEDAELADVLEALNYPDTITIQQLIRSAPEAFSEWLADRRNSRLIPHRLEECGYVAVRNKATKDGRWKVTGKNQVIYGKNNLTIRGRYTAAQARVNLSRP